MLTKKLLLQFCSMTSGFYPSYNDDHRNNLMCIHRRFVSDLRMQTTVKPSHPLLVSAHLSGKAKKKKRFQRLRVRLIGPLLGLARGPSNDSAPDSWRDGDDDGGELLLSLERSLPLRIRLEACCSRRCLSGSFSCWICCCCCCCCSRRRSFSASSCCCFMAWSSCWSWGTCRFQFSTCSKLTNTIFFFMCRFYFALMENLRWSVMYCSTLCLAVLSCLISSALCNAVMGYNVFFWSVLRRAVLCCAPFARRPWGVPGAEPGADGSAFRAASGTRWLVAASGSAAASEWGEAPAAAASPRDQGLSPAPASSDRCEGPAEKEAPRPMARLA